MALSVIVYPGDGVRTQFNIPFALGYIKESDVTARVDGEVDGAGNQIYRTLVFLSPEIVEVQGPVVPVGTNIIFERTVVQDELIVDYEDGDVINEDNMNTSQKQMIMLVHQVLDGRFAQFQSGFDMGGFRISGLGDPVDPGDAVNKRYVDGLLSDGAANAAIAVAARDAAIAARNVAQASQASAAISAGNAAASETSARTSAQSATASANSADSSKNAAAISASQAEASNVNAANAMSGAAAAAGAASSSATQALAFRNQAETFKTDAENSKTSASSSASAAATSQNYAYQWSSNPENNQVNDGVRTGYSAYHWAMNAKASADAAQTWNPNNYVAKTGSTMTGGLTLPNMLVNQTAGGEWAAVQLRTAGSANWVNFGKRNDSHAAYIQPGPAYRWDFSVDGVIELPSGGRLNRDGNVYMNNYGTWVDAIIARSSRMRMAGPAWADIRGSDGIRDTNLGGSVCLTGLTTNGAVGDNRYVIAMFYRQLQQTDIAGNWYAIPSL